MYQSIIGLVVEFVVAIDEARVRFTDDAYLIQFLISQSLSIGGSAFHQASVIPSPC